MAEVESTPTWAADMAGNRKREEKVIYYRNKRGWITWGDTQPSKQLHMMQKGCQPLPQYGYITDSSDLWGPILRHPKGASEFPAEQILAFRWYRNPPVPGVKFPQLAGMKIVEFECPECSRPGFHTPIDLGSHLRVMHSYDRSEVLKYGEAMNIDFSKVPGGKEIVEYDFTEQAVAEIVEAAEELFEVESVSAVHPASDDVKAKVETSLVACPDCGKEVKPNGLQMHQMRWCAKKAVPA